MSDDKMIDEVLNEKKSVLSSPDVVTKMRARPPIEKTIGQKLLEVKGHKPHFDNMANSMGSLLKVVDCSSMTLNPNNPTLPGKQSSPARPSMGMLLSPNNSSSLRANPVLMDESLPAEDPSMSSNSPSLATNSLSLATKLSSPANQASSLEGNANLSVTGLSWESQSSPKIPGSPIEDGNGEQPACVPAIITSLVTDEDNNGESPMEELNTWECAQVERAEDIVDDSGVTMFIRNPNGSYDLFTGVQIPGMQVEQVTGREITINDGPLIILTRDDEGSLTYDPDDSVTIDIQDHNIYVLNTFDGTPCYAGTINTEGGDSGNGGNSELETDEMSSELVPYPVPVAHEEVIELDPESFAIVGAESGGGSDGGSAAELAVAVPDPGEMEAECELSSG